MSLLTVSDLKKYFPLRRGLLETRLEVRAVDGVSFSMGAGEILGLAGESGCGKTTLGRLILRLIEPTAGEIIFDGYHLGELRGAELRRMRRHMQIIFQDPFASLNPRQRVGEILAEPLRIHGETVNGKVFELLDAVGLGREAVEKFPHEFSGGQRQRIAIARALALKPRFIVADEPVAALDVSVQAQVLNLLLDLREQLGLTYLLISHSVPVLRHVADHIAVMYLGKLAELGPAEEVVARPRHPYTQMLIRSVPTIPPRRVAAPLREQPELPSPLAPPPGCRFHTRCPIAVDRCKVEEPAWREISPGHFVACHLA